MLLRKSLKTLADIMELLNFVQDRFESHGLPSFTGAKKRRSSDGLLSSEDLKEEKLATTPMNSISQVLRGYG